MIFGKGKKDEEDHSISRPLENAALDRWRSVDKSSDEILSEKEASLPFEQSESSIPELYISDEESREEVFTLQEEIFDEIDYPVLDLQKVVSEPVDEVKEEPVLIHALQTPREKIPASDFSKDVDQDIKDRFGSNLKSALGSGTVIEGMFSFEDPVKIDGVLRGEIRSTSALIVGPSAEVHARIQVGSLIVLGIVEGEIEAQDLIEVRSTGSLQGDVVTRRLALEEGGFFNGACTMID